MSSSLLQQDQPVDDAALDAMIGFMDDLRRRQQLQSMKLQAELGAFATSELEALTHPSLPLATVVPTAAPLPRTTPAATDFTMLAPPGRMMPPPPQHRPHVASTLERD